ncbi:MAG: hypothetical protein ACQEXB_24255 [Bacillota bacterium]
MKRIGLSNKIKTFDFEDLNGKTLKILADRGVDGLVVMGLDIETDKIYLLKIEPNIETK